MFSYAWYEGRRRIVTYQFVLYNRAVLRHKTSQQVIVHVLMYMYDHLIASVKVIAYDFFGVKETDCSHIVID